MWRRALWAIGWFFTYPSLAAGPPNILLLVAEDLSPRIGSYGDAVAMTPHLDALAQQSIRYTQVFTTAGVCAPSRAALITGQHQSSFGAGHMRTSTGPLGPYLALPPAELRALPELLRAAGYFTYTDRKLDYQFSGVGAGTGPFTLWDRQAAADTAWRERAADQPFFALINLLETHESGVMRATGAAWSDSHQQTQAMRRQFGLIAKSVTTASQIKLPPYYPDVPAVRADLARHYDNIHAMDHRVGAILAALTEDGLAEETVVIWTTDHGDGLPRAKRELYDSGIHVPLLLRLPKALSLAHEADGGTDNRLVSFVDLAPTVLTLAGIKPPSYLHGQNFLTQHRRYVFAARDRIDEVNDRQRAVRSQRYKYIRSDYPDVPGGHPLRYRDNLDGVRAMRQLYEAGELTAAQARWFEPAGAEQLYDLTVDPFELKNLARDPEHQTALVELRQALDQFLTRVGDDHQPESELRAALVVNNETPQTPAPDIRVVGKQIHLSSSIGASIGYRERENEPWQLYKKPINRLKTLQVKSVRYGWRESKVVTLSP